jgi:hypothetical protein
VAGIFSNNNSLFNYGAQSFQGRAQQARQDFTQLSKDLQSGDVSAAQQDFAALQQFAPPSGSASPANSSSNDSPLADDFSQLGQDLQSGDTSVAQQDFAKIQQDFQSRSQAQQQATPRPHHSHHRSPPSGEGQTLTQLGQALQSGDLSSAQQAYLSLQQEIQQFDDNNLSLLNASIGAFTPGELSLSA